MKKVLPNIHMLRLGSVNAYLIEDEELCLVDTGHKGNEQKIFNYIHRIQRNPEELTSIVVTHLHPDHAGSAAALQAATRARVYMHPADAELVEDGIAFRSSREVSPGFMNRLIYNLAIKDSSPEIASFTPDETVVGGDMIPVAGGLRVVHLPGHTEGQIGLLTQNDEVLFAADSSSNMLGLSMFPFYEDLRQASIDLEGLCQLDFEIAFFGHGNPITTAASQKFRKKFAGEQVSLA